MTNEQRKLKSRLGICDICMKSDAKYTCPGCYRTSCSLTCNKKHKKATECDGIRVRTSFVKLDKFGNLDLLSDYRLLDEISCKVDSCHRDPLKKGINSFQYLNKSTKLKQAVLSRGTDFVVLPNQFLRHKINSSVYDVRNREIKWKIQLTFLNASRLTVYEDKCSEEIQLSTLISKHLQASSTSLSAVAYKKLETYRTMGLTKITVLMKAEKVPASDKKFYKLDMGKSLKQNFKGKTIVEFPQLFLVLNGCFTTRKTPKGGVNDLFFPLEKNSLHPTPNDYSTSSSEEIEDHDEKMGEKEEVDGKLPSYRDLLKN